MKGAVGGLGGMEVVMGKLRLGILGNGYLAGIVVEAFEKGLLPEYELVGIMGRTPEKTGALAERAGGAPCGSIGELLDRKPDYIAEAASVAHIVLNHQNGPHASLFASHHRGEVCKINVAFI